MIRCASLTCREANGVLYRIGGSKFCWPCFSERSERAIEPSNTLEDSQSPPNSTPSHTSALQGSVALWLRSLGIKTLTLGEEFPCVIPGHDHAATLVSASDHIKYRCENARCGLSEVRAFQAYGKVKHLNAVEIMRWRERLHYEAGVVRPRPVSFEAPDGVREPLRRAIEGWALLVGLRGVGALDPRVWSSGEPFQFSRKFAAPWCGITEKQARTATEEMLQMGLMWSAGKSARREGMWDANLYRPPVANVIPLRPAGRVALVERLAA